MQFYRYPFVILNGCIIAGILWGKLDSSYVTASIVLLVLSIMIYTYFRCRKHFSIILCILSFFIGWGNYTLTKADMGHQVHLAGTIDNSEINVTGTTTQINRVKSGKYRTTIHLQSIIKQNQYFKINSKIFLYTDGIPNWDIADTVIVSGTFFQFNEKRNPGQFDFRGYYAKKGVIGNILPITESTVLVRPTHSPSLLKWIAHVRNDIKAIFSTYLNSQDAGLLTALLLGDRSGIDPEMKSQFEQVGVIHVLAVSGLHVGYILLILTILTPILQIPWGYDRIAIVGGLCFFAALTNFAPSVNRACIMGGLYMIAPVLNRGANPWNILSAASWMMLMTQPQQCFELGFILSFLAVGSILFFYNLITSALPEPLRIESISNPVIRGSWALFIVSLSAQIGTIPITLIFFKKLPLIALVANVIIVPLIGCLVAGGIMLISVGSIPIFAEIVANTIWLIDLIVSFFAQAFSKIPFGQITVNNFQFIHIIYYVIIISSVVFLMKKSMAKAIIAVSLLITILVWQWTLKRHTMDIVFLDVGQGDCIVIQNENGKTMVVDTGYRTWKQDMGKQVLVPALHHMGTKSVTWLVLTHPHNDHIGGTMSLLHQFTVDTIYESTIDYGSFTYNQVVEEAQINDIPLRSVQAGNTLRIDNHSYLQWLHPDTVEEQTSINNNSVVFRLLHGNNSFLFMGDLEKEGESQLLAFKLYLDSDVLKIGHHGSNTSSSNEFITEVRPSIGVISVGEKNKFNHPSQETINRFGSFQTEIYRTDKQRAVWLRSDGKSIELVPWK